MQRLLLALYLLSASIALFAQPDIRLNQNTLNSSWYVDYFTNNDPCYVNEGCLSGTGARQLLRFTTRVENIGTQDYHIGAPPSNINQSNPLWTFDQCHQHWHYENYARYSLYDANGNLLPASFKNGFCLLDIGCNSGATAKYTCSNQGITAGCYDIYSAGLPCQWVDITTLPSGNYRLLVEANWGHSPDIDGRTESSYANNSAEFCFTLTRSGTQVDVAALNCSNIGNACNISTTAVSNIACNGNNTSVTTDDTYGFQLTVSGTGTSSSGWSTIINGATITGSYGVPKTIGNFNISAGTLNFTVRDNVNANCTKTVTVTPPAPCSSTSTNTIDLELSSTGSTSTPTQWANHSVTFNIINKGAATATGVKVKIPIPSGEVYQGGNEYTATQGSFSPYYSQEWMVGNLAANATASITVRYFRTGTGTFSQYAQVIAAAPNDIDSQVNNGTGTSANQDDETIYPGGSAPTGCSINGTISAIQCNNNGTNTNPNDDTFTFNLTVSGAGTGDGWNTTIGTTTFTGTYGAAKIIGPFPVSGGNVNFVIKDNSTATCTNNQMVIPPSTCSSGSTGSTGQDIQLTATKTGTNGAYQLQSAIFTVKNTGTVTVNNIAVGITIPASGITLQGGNEYTSTQGVFTPYGTKVWSVGTLGAGAQATLTLNFFTLTTAALPIYGQVTAHGGTDTDSQPNNGTCCTPNQDDEAVTTLNSTQNRSTQQFDEVDVASLTIFPNPTDGYTYLDLSAWKGRTVTVSLLNQYGVMLTQMKLEIEDNSLKELDLDNIENGMYLINIQSENVRPITKKLVVQRTY
ncbi:MAG: T9SS type A sorting domain-containing protein [Saprospiraceae bacterium]|nr:T9SS type A sorting domain-containing protein [Saprospiraceae bacterium]MBP7679903.1 T9SS type A sorting domain-containing protein [Saprospiraceae bacterium]